MLSSPATETQITHARRLWLYALVGLIVLFLIAPSLLIIPLSFSAERYLAFPPSAWSTRWYEAYFGAVEWRDATYVSFFAAFLTMVLSTILGTMVEPVQLALPETRQQRIDVALGVGADVGCDPRRHLGELAGPGLHQPVPVRLQLRGRLLQGQREGGRHPFLSPM